MVILSKKQSTGPSTKAGMGAVPYKQGNDVGTTFRVWAPYAQEISVAGSFNNWNKEENPLFSEGNGYRSADVNHAVVGDKYKFVIKDSDSNISWKRDPYTKRVSKTHKNSVICDLNYEWTCNDFQMPSWNELVIYEMHIGTFNDQQRNDNMPGNLDTAISRLPHLKNLGINAIELMPSSEFPGAYSWGYNPCDIFAIEGDYGGPIKLKEFIDKAHKSGIAVLMDVVYNHFGPGDLDLWQFDGWKKWHDKGGIYFYNDSESKTPWGDTRPDYGRGEVRQLIRDNVLFWLEEFRIDGLRWDATAFIRSKNGNDNDAGNDIPAGWSLMQWVNAEIKSRQPWKITIAEDLRNNNYLTKPGWDGGAGFDSQWCANFVHPVREAIISSDDNHRNMYAIKDALYSRFDTDAFKRIIYTESHDEVANGSSRVTHEIDNSADLGLNSN